MKTMALRTTLAAAGLVLMALPALAVDLRVTVSGVAHDRGAVHLALYDGPDTFRDEEKARARTTLPAVPGDVVATFRDLPAGTYALIAYHDEDGDGAMDRFLGMIPTEGYGLSNDPEVSGPPQFDACAFRLDGAATADLVVPLHY